MSLEETRKEEYNRRFNEESVRLFVAYGIQPDVANSYPSRFGVRDIVELVERKVSPNVARTYNRRFDGSDIAELFQPSHLDDHQSGQARQEYQDRLFSQMRGVDIFDPTFDEFERDTFNAYGDRTVLDPISSSVADQYSKRFSGLDIMFLVVAGITPEKAEEYSSRFDGESIIHLIKNKISASEAKKYDKRFNGEQIATLKMRGVDQKTIREYIPRFNGWDIVRLIEDGVPAWYARVYDSRFSGLDIGYLVRAGVKPVAASRYDESFSGYTIAELSSSNISPHRASKYNQRFNGRGISLLVRSGVSPEKADRYDHLLNGDNIALLHQLGITPQNTPLYHQRKLLPVLEFISDRLYWVAEMDENPFVDTGTKLSEYSFLGTGAQSVVISHEKSRSAFKVGENLENEIDCLERLKRSVSSPQNVVILKNSRKIHSLVSDALLCVIELGYIPGASLHQVLKRKKKCTRANTLKYAAGIFNGLQELHQAGIYHHRDLRPANIMIDEKHDRAVIIDLGIATTDKDALARDNRGFGSPSGRVANDLTSLGQIIYRMATGRHLFMGSRFMEHTVHLDIIRDHRDWVYEDPEERLRPYLETVEQRVRDPTFRDIVTFCLRSGGTDEDYQRLDQRFRNVT